MIDFGVVPSRVVADSHLFRATSGRILGAAFGPHIVYAFGSDLVGADIDELSAWKRHQVPHGEQLGTIALLFEAKPMSAEVSEATNRLLKELGPKTRASATVISAQGFVASAARAMAATLFLVSRIECPRRVFANVGEAGEWLAGHFDDPRVLEPGVRWLSELESRGRSCVSAPQ